MIKIRGIVWSLHPLFAVIMLMSVLTGYFIELLTLFTLVLIHEIGHVAAARGFGWTVRAVRLLPFGGVAEMEEEPGAPSAEEAVVALAGPLQNVWMGAAAWALGHFGLMDSAAAAYIAEANAILVLFNMLPIYPLDGGRLLKVALSFSFNYYKALQGSVVVGMALSVLMVGYSIYPLFFGGGVHANLLAVGFFLLASNWTQRRNLPFVFVRFLMHRDRVAVRRITQGAHARPIVVTAGQSIWSTVRLFLREQYHLVYVMEERGKIVRVLPEQRIIEGYLAGDRAVSDLFR
ncbi:M50 family metallopeptidase [Paenibacillus beijingensis]|uniref:Zn-dependent protease n=1 Tax=Paenibacillus beijingensis TaxID=1126833 RepID=A0A0D5NLB6_9BACL|nr:M50 family metallopeptidase [Paenibacillus beijingensis]AJY76066.1 Zn-dependent protease [Paenibacillus beijingensis]